MERVERSITHWMTTCHNGKVDQRIGDLAVQENIITTSNFQRVLRRAKIDISQEIIRRRLKEQGSKFSPSISRLFLPEKHRLKCLQWTKCKRNSDWIQVVFCDKRIQSQMSFYKCP